jgi:hypothetical protein
LNAAVRQITLQQTIQAELFGGICRAMICGMACVGRRLTKV